jgi:cobalamin-dependent methionine synthase I
MYVKGVVGMFVTNRSDDGEDVALYEDEAARAAGNPMHTFCMLRQQAEKEKTINPISAKLISLHQRDTNQESTMREWI